MARLIMHPDTPRARVIALKVGSNSIGRGGNNDVVVDDPSVSTSHCEVTVSDGAARLRDLGSTNGTFVNGAPVTDITLAPRQTLRLGGVPFTFEIDGASVRVISESSVEQAASPPAIASAEAPSRPRLRIGGHQSEAPPAAVAAPVEEAPPLDAPPIAFDAPTNAPCKYHPRTLARWVCTGCHKTYCDLCVSARPGAGAGQMFCRSCGGLAAPLEVRIEAPEAKNFFRELPRAFVYPFRGSGIMMLVVATIIFTVLDVISAGFFAWIMKAAAIGYIFSYAQNIIHSTAADDDRMPEMPGMDDVFGGFFRLAGAVLISFGPAFIVAFLAFFQEMPAAGVALIPAIIFGCLYFPMAFLAVAMKDNVMASNPLIVVPSILRVPLEYLVAAILVVGVFGVRWAGDYLSASVAGRSLMTTSMTEMFLLFGFRAIWAFISVYLLTVTTRILGVLYVSKRDQLGW